MDAIKTIDDIKLENINLAEAYSIDFRAVDLSELDLTNNLDILKNADFSTLTIFPDDSKMPEGFKRADRERLLEMGKYKDFGILELRKEKITGKGIKVAIIDQLLNIYEYPEIKGKIQPDHYFEFGYNDKSISYKSSMHGIAVSSILCGHEIGIAPDVELYYFAADNADHSSPINQKTGLHKSTYQNYIRALDKILEINEDLVSKEEQPIRIVSVSWELSNDDREMANIMKEQLEKMEMAGVSVIDVDIDFSKHPLISGFKRDFNNEKIFVNGFDSSRKYNEFVKKSIESGKLPIFVPMSNRTIALYIKANSQTQEYSYDVSSGTSWTIPYFTGLFALARQVNPEIELEDFYKIAQKTGTDLIDKTDRQLIGKIVQPIKLIKEMEKTIDGIKVEKPNETWVEKITKSDKTCGQNLK